MQSNKNNCSQQADFFNQIAAIIEKVNVHQTPALSESMVKRSKWNPDRDQSDCDILKECIKLIAYSQQAKACRVEVLINEGIFDKIFLKYNVRAVANLEYEQLHSKYWSQIGGAIRYPKKLKSMIGCAQALLKINENHKSFMTLLRGFEIPTELRSPSDIDEFWIKFTTFQQRLQQKQMPFFNKLTSLCHLLMIVGYPCLKPDSIVMGVAVRLGVISPGSGKKNNNYNDEKRMEVVKTMQAYCLSRKFNIHSLDKYLLIDGGQTGAIAQVYPQYYKND